MAYLQIQSEVIEIASIALVIVTLALVGITAYYAYQTRNTVNAVRASSEMSIRPHLKGTIKMMGPLNCSLLISNVGNGPANRINLQYWIENIEQSRRNWTKPLLMPKDKEEFFIARDQNNIETSIQFFQNNPSVLRITGEYEDMIGNTHTIDDSINITEYVTQFEQTSIRFEEDALDRIVRQLENISRELGQRRQS